MRTFAALLLNMNYNEKKYYKQMAGYDGCPYIYSFC